MRSATIRPCVSVTGGLSLADRAASLLNVTFVRFLFIGAINTAFGYGLFSLLVYISIEPVLALLVATVIGVCFNFFTTGGVVFKNLEGGRFGRFVTVYVVYFALNAVLLEGLRSTGLSAYAAQAVALPPLVIGLYIAQRRFVFHEHTPGPDRKGSP